MSEKVKIEIENDEFLKKFEKTAAEIEDNIADLSGDIKRSLVKLEDIIPQVEYLEELNYIPNEVLGIVKEIHLEVRDIYKTVDWNEQRIIKLLNHFDIEDPKITYFKEYVFNDRLDLYIDSNKNKSRKNINYEDFLKNMETFEYGATKEQLRVWLDEYLKENG